MSQWPLDIEEWEYHPIPDSWLDHPRSRINASHQHAVYAVSAAKWGGKTLRIRYIHPPSNQVFGAKTGAAEYENGVVPLGLLTGRGWPKAMEPSFEPIDAARQPEIEHFEELWGDRIAPSHTSATTTDGGQA